jgi:hypothetical protein
MKAILLAAVALLAMAKAAACSCPVPPDVESSRMNSVAVFAGEVLASRDSFKRHTLLVAGESTEVETRPGARIVLLRVLRAWKGAQADTVLTAVASTQGGSFQAGDSYLVYAADSMLARDRDRWLAGSQGRALRVGCSRTQLLRNAAEDLKTLGLETSDTEWLRTACRTWGDSLTLLPLVRDLERRGRVKGPGAK